MAAAIFNGFGAGILWCAFGVYISECATPTTKGFYFGLFWFFYMMSMTVGSLIGAAMLGSGMNETYFYIILSAMALTASLSFLLVRKPLP
jgi:MFS family permease